LPKVFQHEKCVQAGLTTKDWAKWKKKYGGVPGQVKPLSSPREVSVDIQIGREKGNGAAQGGEVPLLSAKQQGARALQGNQTRQGKIAFSGEIRGVKDWTGRARLGVHL